MSSVAAWGGQALQPPVSALMARARIVLFRCRCWCRKCRWQCRQYRQSRARIVLFRMMLVAVPVLAAACIGARSPRELISVLWSRVGYDKFARFIGDVDTVLDFVLDDCYILTLAFVMALTIHSRFYVPRQAVPRSVRRSPAFACSLTLLNICVSVLAHFAWVSAKDQSVLLILLVGMVVAHQWFDVYRDIDLWSGYLMCLM